MTVRNVFSSPSAGRGFPGWGALSVSEFAKWANISRSKVFDEIRDGRLHPKKVGTRTIIFGAEAERWASELPNSDSAPEDISTEEE